MWWVLEARAYAPNIVGRLLGTSFPILRGRLRHGQQITSRRNYTTSSITKVCLILKFIDAYETTVCFTLWNCNRVLLTGLTSPTMFPVLSRIKNVNYNIRIQVSLFCLAIHEIKHNKYKNCNALFYSMKYKYLVFFGLLWVQPRLQW